MVKDVTVKQGSHMVRLTSRKYFVGGASCLEGYTTVNRGNQCNLNTTSPAEQCE